MLATNVAAIRVDEKEKGKERYLNGKSKKTRKKESSDPLHYTYPYNCEKGFIGKRYDKMIRSVSRAFLAFHLVKFGHAKSYFFLTSQSPRCATVEVPSATFVHVTYDVPGRSMIHVFFYTICHLFARIPLECIRLYPRTASRSICYPVSH